LLYALVNITGTRILWSKIGKPFSGIGFFAKCPLQLGHSLKLFSVSGRRNFQCVFQEIFWHSFESSVKTIMLSWNIHTYKYLRVYKKFKNYFGGHKKLTLSTEKSNLASLSDSGFFTWVFIVRKLMEPW